MDLRVLQYFFDRCAGGEYFTSRRGPPCDPTHPQPPNGPVGGGAGGCSSLCRGRHLTLTDAGVMLRRRAEEVTALMEKMQQELEGHADVGGWSPSAAVV